jgi:hypothetical protein
MDCPRASGCKTDPKLPGVLCKPSCHECRGFFMPDANEPNTVLPFTERFEDGIDSVSYHSKNVCYAPCDQSFRYNIRGVLIGRRPSGLSFTNY